MKKIFYTYYSYEVGFDTCRGYIGKRGCYCLPEEDTNYFGSFSDGTFNPTKKTIINVFETEEEALHSEVCLHWLFNVDKNTHFANKSKQTSLKFCYDATGSKQTEETRQKIAASKLGVPGTKHSEETKQKYSEMRSGERNPMFGKLGEEHPCFGKTWVWNEGSKLRRKIEAPKGIEHPCFGKKWWCHPTEKSVMQREKPGPDWQNGRKWKPQQ